jgi:hypothetical protein
MTNDNDPLSALAIQDGSVIQWDTEVPGRQFRAEIRDLDGGTTVKEVHSSMTGGDTRVAQCE